MKIHPLLISNSQLGRRLAGQLGLPWRPLKLSRFPDGELRLSLQIKDEEMDVILLFSLTDGWSVNDSLTALLLSLAHLRRQAPRGRLTLILPYLPYARQDKESAREIAAGRDLLAILKNLAENILSLDPHADEKNLTEWFAPGKFITLPPDPLFLDYLRKTRIKNYFLAAPDSQAAERYQQVAAALAKPLVIFAKKRLSGEKVKQTLASPLPAGVPTAVFMDDIISTGGTLLEAQKILKRKGVKNFYALVSHFAGSAENLKNLRQAGFKIIATNSIERPHLKDFTRLDALPLFADYLKLTL